MTTLCTYNKTEPHETSPEVCAWHAERRDANCADCDNYKNLVHEMVARTSSGLSVEHIKEA